MTTIRNKNREPDPKFEQIGWNSWFYLKFDLIQIKKDFDLYGDGNSEIFLKKKLGESYDIYKDAFPADLSSGAFEKAIRKIWESRYHIVVKDLKELLFIYKIAVKEGFSMQELLPESKSYKEGETRGNDASIALSKELYLCIVNETLYKGKNKIYILNKDNDVFKITYESADGFNTYGKTSIKLIETIKIN